MRAQNDNAADVRTAGQTNFLKTLLMQPEVPIVIFIVVLSIFLNAITGSFFDPVNLSNILKQIAVNGVITVGMALALLSGGIDLSVGAAMGLAVSVAGTFILMNAPLWTVTMVAAAVGIGCGFLNGILIVRLSIAPIIVTLGTMNIYRGIAFIYTGGQWQSALPKEYLFFGTGVVPVFTWLAVAVLLILVMRYTRYGRHVYAVGGDQACAELAGIRVPRVKVVTYALVGVLVGLAAMLFIGRTSAVQSSAGTGYETQAIAAAVLGGISITGGKGRLLGTVFGTVLMGLILNAMTMLKISANWQGLATGAVIILALLLESARNSYMKRGDHLEK